MDWLYSAIVLQGSGLLVFILGRVFPRKWINPDFFWFRSWKWEKDGKAYEKIAIKKWKTKWPDFSNIITKIFPNIMPKKRLDKSATQKLPTLIKECCVAETTHEICFILGFIPVAIWPGVASAVLSVLWALTHIPPIIIQRYNRPRFKQSLAKINKRLD